MNIHHPGPLSVASSHHTDKWTKQQQDDPNMEILNWKTICSNLYATEYWLSLSNLHWFFDNVKSRHLVILGEL